jgi:hypothetical protein
MRQPQARGECRPYNSCRNAKGPCERGAVWIPVLRRWLMQNRGLSQSQALTSVKTAPLRRALRIGVGLLEARSFHFFDSFARILWAKALNIDK